MFSGVATGLFCLRNIDKTANGDSGRLPVSIAQGAGALKVAAQSDSVFAKPLKSAFNNLHKLAESDKVVNGVSKTVKFASEHVNHLIVGASLLKVAQAKKEDREKTIIAESGCLAGMFAGESWMKKNLTGVLEKLPINKKWAPIVKGVCFVTGSIGASTLGLVAGEKVAKYWDVPLCPPTKPTTTDKQNYIYNQIDLKA